MCDFNLQFLCRTKVPFAVYRPKAKETTNWSKRFLMTKLFRLTANRVCREIVSLKKKARLKVILKFLSLVTKAYVT